MVGRYQPEALLLALSTSAIVWRKGSTRFGGLVVVERDWGRVRSFGTPILMSIAHLYVVEYWSYVLSTYHLQTKCSAFSKRGVSFHGHDHCSGAIVLIRAISNLLSGPNQGRWLNHAK